MSAKAEQEVKAMVEEMKKNECGSGADITGYYAENAVFMPPGDPNLIGKKEIIKGFAEWYAKNPPEPGQKYNMLSQKIWAPCETCAIEVGEWNKMKDDKVIEKGSNVRVFEKIGDEWKILYHVFNTQTPK